MLAYYKGKLLVISLVILLDGLIIYFIPSYYHNLNYFYPMLTVSLIPFLFFNNQKKYFHLILFIGFIYDLFYSNIFLYHTLIFLLLAKINYKLIKYFNGGLLFYLVLIIINILIYDLIGFLIIYFTNYQEIAVIDLLYKLKNSLIVNILSGFVYYFLFKNKIIFHKM